MILGLHWLFDFVLQTPDQAEGKSKHVIPLLDHCLVYSLWGVVMSLMFPMANAGMLFFPYLFATHFIVDGVTSRITSWLWRKKQVHDFFVMIGADQIIHYVSIFWYLDWTGLVK